MPEVPPSPRAARLATPSWLDARLVGGVLLVLVAVVVGARLLSSADHRQSVWVLTHDLAAGSTLADGDLRAGDVKLFASGDRYLLAGADKPLGYVLQRAVGRGELLPRDSLVRPDARRPGRRDVSVPVAAGHLPDDLAPGQQVDVYASADGRRASPASSPASSPAPSPAPSPSAGSAGPADPGTALVLGQLPVTLRPRAQGLGAGGTQSVVLSVPEGDVPRLVAALQAGGVDLVRVPRGDELPALAGAAAAAGTG